MTTPFSALALDARFLANLDTLGYKSMTPVQAASLPPALEGRDLIVQAHTGSGKTAAFGIGMLNRLNPTLFAVQGLVLCPTRELADQVAQELRRLARGVGNIKILTLTGGVALRPQAASLEHGAHIVVGTPGRVRDHLARRTLDLKRVQVLVLDEADRMTDMGFYDDIAAVARDCPQWRQTLLFSATYPDDIRAATSELLRDPVEIVVDAAPTRPRIEQRFHEVPFESRDDAVATLLGNQPPGSAIVFCNTRVHCQELADLLHERGFAVRALYGELEQRERDEILLLFSNRTVSVLVATDVAARGLDIADLDVVINAGMTPDPEVYVHRIGRTGRAGATGLALTLCTSRDKKWVAQLENASGETADWQPLPPPVDTPPAPAPMLTLCIAGGKKDKLRPADLLGALTGDAGLTREQVGKINITQFTSYVAVAREVAGQALERLSKNAPLGGEFGAIKGRHFRMRLLAA
ncbi:ATP-dependent RNA helicase DbpA [Massilia terrae]|uniref:ATP-dependent RNA helicase DbpA n=1 Tax=Massilia terrae TaxID=1811224 RepID=A0ABT2CSA2_9BURK|nr:ATP-dependent RNA helicase DbpA [Massilia terrae]MCS0656704.1 ATP-dependent RNA helicase DbpA [Massilia terrae]